MPADASTSAMAATIARTRFWIVDIDDVGAGVGAAGAVGGQVGVAAAQPGGGPHPLAPPAPEVGASDAGDGPAAYGPGAPSGVNSIVGWGRVVAGRSCAAGHETLRAGASVAGADGIVGAVSASGSAHEYCGHVLSAA